MKYRAYVLNTLFIFLVFANTLVFLMSGFNTDADMQLSSKKSCPIAASSSVEDDLIPDPPKVLTILSGGSQVTPFVEI